MGCDIHAYVETKSKRDTNGNDWGFLCSYRFSRNYALFALMAGVRRYSTYPNPKKLEEALRKRAVDRLDDPNLSLEEGVTIMKEGCDSGITEGQPSFDEKGIPEDISWETAKEFTLYVVPDDDDEDKNEGTCTRSQADSWVAGGSSDIWDLGPDGAPIRVTNPDMHSGSWLNTDEVVALAERFYQVLLTHVPDAKKMQAQSAKWAADGLKKARKDNNEEQVAYFERELAREADWMNFDPMREHAYVATEALAALMTSLEAHGVNARVVFWFDN